MFIFVIIPKLYDYETFAFDIGGRDAFMFSIRADSGGTLRQIQ